MFGKKEEEMTLVSKGKLFLAVHWRGVVCFLTPIIMLAVLAPFPPQPINWCRYTMAVMAIYWMTECIPLEITSFLPVLVFPLTNVMTTAEVCKAYMHEILLLLLGSLFLAYALEQSGLFTRMVYCCLSLCSGKSHTSILSILWVLTQFTSMWIPNTTATALMIPILLSLFKVFEGYGSKMYDSGPGGEKVASDLTTGYFCSISYSATFGGLMTLIGTATNLAMKGLYLLIITQPEDLITFGNFLALAVIAPILMGAFSFLYMAVMYFGLFRKESDAAKNSVISKKASDAFKKLIVEERKKLGKFTMREGMVVGFFVIAILGFILRHPGIFQGWGDMIKTSFMLTDSHYVRDSSFAVLVCFIIFLLPASMQIMKNFQAKVHEELPKTSVTSVLDWTKLNTAVPFSFMFVLGAGFALCEAMKLSEWKAAIMLDLKSTEKMNYMAAILIIILIVVILTNFSSNVVIANLACPFAMLWALVLGLHPLWFGLAAGLAASLSFMLPIGTPGNVLVHRAVNIPIKKMIIAGSFPTVISILLLWANLTFFAPILFPSLNAKEPEPPADAAPGD